MTDILTEPRPTLMPVAPAIHIDEATKRLVNYAANLEGSDEMAMDIGYSARLWAQVSLPYRNPGEIPYWERKNGNVSLMMQPAYIPDPETGERRAAYPFGVLPRQAMNWMATEAVLTGEKTLHLGDSMMQFMAKIGLAHGGRDHKRVNDGLRRLFGANLSVEGLEIAEDGNGHGEAIEYFRIADSVRLWFGGKDESTSTPLWQSSVTLSDRFFDSIVSSPVPIDLNAMKAMGKSAMRMDIYLWLTYRMFYLRKPTRIKWADLNLQFGAQYKQPHKFKAAFEGHLKFIKIAYPDARVEPTPEYLILRPSKPHVEPTKPRRELD